MTLRAAVTALLTVAVVAASAGCARTPWILDRTYVAGGRRETIRAGRQPHFGFDLDGGDLQVRVTLTDACRAADHGEVRVDSHAERKWYIVPLCVLTVPLLLPAMVLVGRPWYGVELCTYHQPLRRTRVLARDGRVWAEAEHHGCGEPQPAPSLPVTVHLQAGDSWAKLELTATTDETGNARFAGEAARLSQIARYCPRLELVATMHGDIPAAGDWSTNNTADSPPRGLWSAQSVGYPIPPALAPVDWHTLDDAALEIAAGCDRALAAAVCRDRLAREWAAWSSRGGASCSDCGPGCVTARDRCVARCKREHPIRDFGTAMEETVQKDCIHGCELDERSCVQGCGCPIDTPPPSTRCRG